MNEFADIANSYLLLIS